MYCSPFSHQSLEPFSISSYSCFGNALESPTKIKKIYTTKVTFNISQNSGLCVSEKHFGISAHGATIPVPNDVKNVAHNGPSNGDVANVTPEAVIVATIISTLKGKEETIIFWRKVSNFTVRMAFTIFTLFAFAIFIAMIVFMNHNNIGIEKILFDCISAISNTGFSLADPSELNSVGSSILIVLMYIGRIGPLSLVLAFVHKDNRQKFVEYPEEKVIL